MTNDAFEYEERYKVTDPAATLQALGSAGFVLSGTKTQTDHWFIPNRIMTPDQQSHWFDYEAGYALRIREEVTDIGQVAVITAKQLLKPGDHNAMTNNELGLSTAGAITVLQAIGDEFASVVEQLNKRSGDSLSFAEIKQLIESAGRKEYITLAKERSTFRNPTIADVVIDLDTIPALQGTPLGFWASIEIEYEGAESVDQAKQVIRAVSSQLGYNQNDILAKALPGLAIPYLAKF